MRKLRHDPIVKPTKTRPKPQSKKQALAVVTPRPQANGLQLAIAEAQRQKRIDEVLKHSCEVTGARTDEFADRIIVQAAGSLVSPRPKDGRDVRVVAGFAAIAEMAPQNATEAMLATQMIAAHEAAMMFLNRATVDGQYPANIDANVLRALRLMRTFGQQLEALQKLRGKTGQQRVTVEHVHVHEGGQAIVGAVTARGPRKGGGDDDDKSMKHPITSEEDRCGMATPRATFLRRNGAVQRIDVAPLADVRPCAMAGAGFTAD